MTVGWKVVRGLLAIMLACALATVGWYRLGGHVQALPGSQPLASPELVAPPDWVRNSPELQELIKRTAGGANIRLTEDTVKLVATKLEKLSWLYNVSVQTSVAAPQGDKHPIKTLRIQAGYRKPVAMVKRGWKKYYLAWVTPEDPVSNYRDKAVLVLRHIAIEGLPIIEITGLPSRIPLDDGVVCSLDEVVSTVELLTTLARMDLSTTPDKPLLNELRNIDLTNYNKSNDSSKSRVVIYTTDGVAIYWGAPYGQSAMAMETTEEEKIAQLYVLYTQNGTLKGNFKYIDLRVPRVMFPRPMDQ